MKMEMKEQKGYALVTAIIGLLMMSVLGIGIIGVTSSNYKLTQLDSKSQSAYYIAEAGANHIVNEISNNVEENGGKFGAAIEFFLYIEDTFMDKTFTLDDFKENRGDQPKADIIVELDSADADNRNYKITSIGEIGSSKRVVSTVISLNWTGNKELGLIDDVFIFGPKYTFGGTSINGEGGTIVSGGLMTHDLNGGCLINVTNQYYAGSVTMNGGSASFGSEGTRGSIYIDGDLDLTSGTRNVYGDVYVGKNAEVKRKARLKDVIFHDNVFVNGDVEFLENGAIFKGDSKLFYTGELMVPAYYYTNSHYKEAVLSKCEKVNSIAPFTIPSFDIKLKNQNWYTQNGYTLIDDKVTQNEISNNTKLVVDNFKSDHHTSPGGSIVIISNKDIEIEGWRDITGVLIAPNGRVKLNVKSFTGVILSKDGLDTTQGGSFINMALMSDFFTEATMPIELYKEETDSEGENTGGAKLDIKRPIREEKLGNH